MSLVPAFTVSNNNIVTSQFQVSDTSSGSDAAIANRLIYIYDSANNLFTGAPIQFPLSAGNSISPNILTQDFAYSMTMTWTDGSGNVLYTTSIVGLFTGFLEWFYYGLVQMIAAQERILNDEVFVYNWGKLRTLIDSANISISTGGSVFNAQSMILMAQNLIKNQNSFF